MLRRALTAASSARASPSNTVASAFSKLPLNRPSWHHVRRPRKPEPKTPLDRILAKSQSETNKAHRAPAPPASSPPPSSQPSQHHHQQKTPHRSVSPQTNPTTPLRPPSKMSITARTSQSANGHRICPSCHRNTSSGLSASTVVARR
jgi:hypothetical protein